MRPEWTGEVVKQLHVAELSTADLAREMELTQGYVRMILDGQRNPLGAEARIKTALFALLNHQKDEEVTVCGQDGPETS